MNVLIIDSTAEKLVVCGCANNVIASRISSDGSKRHNCNILPYIDEVLKQLGIEINQLDSVGCVVGAGSFTGIRIGVSTIKAIAMACKIPTISVTSFEIVAYNVNERKFAVTLNARHDNYVGVFEENWKNCTQTKSMTDDELKALGISVYSRECATQPEVLIEIAKYKFANNNFSTLQPLYLKKSQAEREKDGD